MEVKVNLKRKLFLPENLMITGLGSSLELVNTQTDVDRSDVVTDNLSAALGTGHAVSEVSLSRRHNRPAGPERSLRSPCSKALVPRRGGGLNRDTTGDVVVTRVSCSHPVDGQSDVPTLSLIHI